MHISLPRIMETAIAAHMEAVKLIQESVKRYGREHVWWAEYLELSPEIALVERVSFVERWFDERYECAVSTGNPNLPLQIQEKRQHLIMYLHLEDAARQHQSKVLKGEPQ